MAVETHPTAQISWNAFAALAVFVLLAMSLTRTCLRMFRVRSDSR